MNCKLPRLAETVRRLHTNPKGEQGRCTTIPRSRVGFVAAVIAVLVPAALLAQQPARQSSYGQSVNKEGRAGEGSAELPAPEEKDGNKLVAEAARQVFRQKAIEAKVRQRSYLFGQEVPGAGEYAQLGAGQQKFLRLEMKMQIGPQPATLLQVSGRQDLWIRRQVPPAPPRLEHVNLTRLRSALMRLDEEGKSIPADNWILFGGLSRLVESLHRNFNFAPPKEGRIGDLAVLILRGEIKPERLKELTREPAHKRNDEEDSTDQLPTAVLLTLGRADQPLPHFPYRIEYLRKRSEKELQSQVSKDKEPSAEAILSVLEFYEVRSPTDLDPQKFEFDPGDEESEDRTQSYISKLKQ